MGKKQGYDKRCSTLKKHLLTVFGRFWPEPNIVGAAREPQEKRQEKENAGDAGFQDKFGKVVVRPICIAGDDILVFFNRAIDRRECPKPGAEGQ